MITRWVTQLLLLSLARVSSLSLPVTAPRKQASTCPVWTVSLRASDFDADVCLVANTIDRREIGWLDLYRTTRSSHLHARLLDASLEIPHLFATNLLVDPSVRRCGVATSLLLAAEQVGKEWGLIRIMISAKPSHLPSWKLYRKMGYAQVRAALSRGSASVLLCKTVA